MTPGLSDALLDVYDTAVNPGRWCRALDKVAGLVDAKGVALVIRSGDPATRNLTLMSSPYLRFSRSFMGYYYGLVLNQLQEHDWDFLSTQVPHQPVPDTNMGLTAAALDKRKDYACLRRRVGVARRVGVRLNTDKIWFDAMSVGFPDAVTKVSPAQMAPLLPLLPHLTKAVEIGRTFTLLKARYKASLAALDHVHVGLAIAVNSGECIVQNSYFQNILENRDGLALDATRKLTLGTAEKTDWLRQQIRDTCATAKGEGSTTAAFAALPRPSGKSDYLIEVAPLRDSKQALDQPCEAALITLIDPERTAPLKLDKFSKLYGLTPSETDVCQLIAEGLNTSEIAEKRTTSVTTAKNQVAAVLSKTDVKSRLELLRLAVRTTPPIS